MSKVCLYEDYARALIASKDIESLRECFLRFSENLGLDKFTYQIVKHNFHHNLSNFYITNFSNEWEKRYLNQNYFNDDPLVTQYTKNMSPFTWGVEKSPIVTPQTKLMFSEANDFHLDKGIGIPIPGPNNAFSVLTLCASNSNMKELDLINSSHGKDLMIAALLFHNAAVSLRLEDTLHQNFELTKKEEDFLKLACIGKSYSEIAFLHGVSVTAIKKRAQNIFMKMGVYSRHEAVLKALKYKVVET